MHSFRKTQWEPALHLVLCEAQGECSLFPKRQLSWGPANLNPTLDPQGVGFGSPFVEHQHSKSGFFSFVKSLLSNSSRPSANVGAWDTKQRSLPSWSFCLNGLCSCRSPGLPAPVPHKDEQAQPLGALKRGKTAGWDLGICC